LEEAEKLIIQIPGSSANIEARLSFSNLYVIDLVKMGIRY